MGAVRISMKKKGIFFTFIAITIMTIFVLVFTPQADVSLNKDVEAVASRIGSVDSYVNDLENSYFETILRATTYKAILSLIFYMNSTGSYITDMDSAFKDVMLTGKIVGVDIDSITGKTIMKDSTLTNWSNKIMQTAADTLNVNTTITIINVSVFQADPWNIKSSMSVNFTVKSNVAKWEKSAKIAASISIEGLNDPYYLVNTDGAYTNKIKKSTVAFNQWNIAKLREHIRNGTYVHWENSNAPSFLMRFTNTITNSSCCGIESLANPNRITPPDVIDSYADYILANPIVNTSCSELYNITNPSTGGGLWDEFRYFKLDSDHVVLYNITAQDSIGAC